ncbi:hypothetical protein QGM71_16895 [Virgibacillus sp. C22-A2]|uniref:Pre-toxin TG domain-containing protein n=1 Tax=Virgibacillus tibetensis TaxID=3042313 RepID=A0ABU6KIL8_9BACI|nr:hypothetical protein [Virgibacillus sp. C22-A2]
MDVKYIPADWEKMRSGLGDLIGLGRWGKGMIDELKDVTENLEDAESDIAIFDSDGVISFSHIDRKNEYQQLFDNFKVMHSFTGKVGDIVERTIDQPFYEDIDAFIEVMQAATISNYTTSNRIGVTETQIIYHGQGIQEKREVPKAEVSLDDLFSGDTFYGDQMRIEYDMWKAENSDQDFSFESYRMAAVNMNAFEYESIKDQQFNKEFWVNIGALVVIGGTAVICPPAALALGAVYGSLEITTAVSGKDWISGRELNTGERWFRGALAPLDIIPSVAGMKKFSSFVRVSNQAADMGQFGLKAGVKTSIQRELNHVGNLVIEAGKQSQARLRNAGNVVSDTAKLAKDKLARDAVELGRIADSAVTGGKNILSTRKVVTIDGVGNVRVNAENTHFFEGKIKDALSKSESINVGAKVNESILSPSSFRNQIDRVLKEHNLTIDEFNKLKLKSVTELNESEILIMKHIRDFVPPITKDTVLQKTIPANDIEKYLLGEYTEIGGYVAKTDDVGHIKNYNDVVESSRLDYKSWDGSRPFPDEGDSYGKIIFKSNRVDNFDIPYGESFGGRNTDGPPCTQNCFTGSRNGEIVPEWQFDGRYLPNDGAELYSVTNNIEKLVAVYDEKLKLFIPVP